VPEPAAPGRRRGLGRGLDALLAPTDRPRPIEDVGAEEMGLVELGLDAIAPNPEQPRSDFAEDALEDLAASIRLHGVLQPIVVERQPGGQAGFRLIAGERRLRAARRAGLASVPAVVRPSGESTRVALELALVENLQRADLTPIEEATAYQRLGEAFGLSAEAIGLRVGRSRPTVANTLRLLQLPAAVQLALRERRLSAGHGRALLGLAAAVDQERLAHRAESRGLSVREVEAAVAAALSAPPGRRNGTAARREVSPDDAALCRGLERVLSTPVRIERRRRGGRLMIEFYDDAQLDTLYKALGGGAL
jgi:ParB family chromosome partitioning protein